MTAQRGPAPIAAAPPRTSFGLTISLLFLVQVCSLIDRQVLSVLIEPIGHALHASDTAMGALTGTAFAAFYIVAAFPIARLADGKGRVLVIVGCTAVWSVATALSGLVRSYAQLAAARCFVAAGEAGAAPAATALIIDLVPASRRGRAMAIFSIAGSVGVGIGLAGGGWLAAQVGWRATFAFVGLPGLLLAAACYWLIREPRDSDTRAAGAMPLRYLLALFRTVPGLGWMFALAAAVAFSNYSILTWAPTFLIRSHGLDVASAGAWMGGATMSALVVGNILTGSIADWLGPRDTRWYMWIPATGAAIAFPMGIGFILFPGLHGAMAFLWLETLAMSAWHATTFAVALSLVPKGARAMISAALTMATTLIGLGLAPALVGMASDALTPRMGGEALRGAMLFGHLGMLAAAAAGFVAARRLKGLAPFGA